MTDKKAIEILRLAQNGAFEGCPADLHEAQEQAIQALEAVASLRKQGLAFVLFTVGLNGKPELRAPLAPSPLDNPLSQGKEKKGIDIKG